MARKAREVSGSGVYHVVLKGDNKLLFADDSDYLKFIELLGQQAAHDFLEICAYCLFSEAVHLVLKEGLCDISVSIKGVTSLYAKWCNHKYDRPGKLFFDRFSSEPIESDEALLAVVAYTHRLPLSRREGLEYQFSSYNSYIKKGGVAPQINFGGGAVMLLLNNSIVNFKNLMENPPDINTNFLSDLKAEKLSDLELSFKIKNLLQGIEQAQIDALAPPEFKALIRRFKKIQGATVRQLARVLNLSKSYVEKA